MTKAINLFAVFLLASCGAPRDGDQPPEAVGNRMNREPADGAHNSRNSLDWLGRYSGILPCADCEGIATTIMLTEGGDVRRVLEYVGKPAKPFVDIGKFEWNAAGSVITLAFADGTRQAYQVGENRLFHLDQAGNRIDGPLAHRYELTKE